MPTIDVIIVAAGSGLRFGAPLPKQFCLLAGRPVLFHTIDAFRRYLPKAHLSVVISADMLDFWQDLCRRYDFSSPVVIPGGSTRWQSISNAIRHLYPDEPEADRIVMVHDGVRPLIDLDTINRLVTAVINDPDIHGAIPAVKVSDSIRQLSYNGDSHALCRDSLRAVQTPQTFRANLLRDAYSRPYKTSFTDDASVMEDAGYNRLILTDGSPDNIKITQPGDIEIAELLLRKKQDR